MRPTDAATLRVSWPGLLQAVPLRPVAAKTYIRRHAGMAAIPNTNQKLYCAIWVDSNSGLAMRFIHRFGTPSVFNSHQSWRMRPFALAHV